MAGKKDREKSKDELVTDLAELRRGIASLERAEGALKRAELAARASREYAENIVETVREPLLVLDSDLKVLSANRSFYDTFKVKQKETIGKLIYNLGNAQWDIPRLRTLLQDILLKDGQVDDFTVDYIFPDIGHKIMMLNARRIPHAETGSGLILLAMEDFTERQRVEDELKDSEERFRRLFETAQDGLLLLDKQSGSIVNANPAIIKLLGYSGGELIGKKFQDVGILQGIHDFNKINQELLEHGFVDYDDVLIETREGDCVDAEIHLVDRARFIQCNVRDITERKKLVSDLKQFRDLTDQSSDSIFVIDPDTGRFLDVNAGACRNLGYGREEFLKLKIFDIQAEILDASWRAHVDETRYKHHLVMEGSNRRKDGTTFPIEVNVSYVPGDIKDYMVAVVRDITERKEAQKTLIKSIEKYKDLFDSTLDGIYQVDADGIFILMNPAGARIFGYERPDEIIGRNALEYWRDPKDREAFRAELKIKNAVSAYPMRAKKKNGEPIELASSSRMIRDGNGNFLGIEGILRDITERKRAEERIQRQVQKFSALHSIDLTISSSLDIHLTLTIFIDHVVKQLGVDAANVLLLNPHSQILEYAASRGFRTAALKHSHLRLGEGYAGIAALQNRIVSVPNLNADNAAFTLLRFLEGEDFITYYGVPLVAKGHVKGVLEILHRSPLEPDEEWSEFLEALALQAAIAIDNSSLFHDLDRSNMDLSLAYDSTLEGWSRALDYRDKETEGHSQRVTEMTLSIARDLGMTEEEIVHVRRGALLHDIGKMGIPDSILLKPGPLTEEEWKIMRLHPVYCYELLHPIAYLRPALDIPCCHHEKWDGSGYPRGLRGEQIPLSARIFAAVDVWDALRSDRPYRPAWSKEKAKEYILSLSGIQFDPKVVEAFMRAVAARKDL
jgi:PAS domain S-box-containing protein